MKLYLVLVRQGYFHYSKHMFIFQEKGRIGAGKMISKKQKEEGPRHPPPIAGFSSFCNLITKDNITDTTTNINQKSSLQCSIF